MAHRSSIFWIALLGVVAAGSIIFTRYQAAVGSASSDPSLPRVKVTVYKDPTCGCCGNYIAYLKRNGFDVETVNNSDMESVKQKFHVPADMESCHTTVIGDAFVEGHIPVEAVRRFLDDPQGLAGIAMPGMPSGSPGMPGGKTAPFDVHGVKADGTVSEYLQL